MQEELSLLDFATEVSDQEGYSSIDEVPSNRATQIVEEEQTSTTVSFEDIATAVEEALEETSIVSVPTPPLRPTSTDQEDRLLPLDIPEDVQQDTGFMSSVESVSGKLGIPSEDLLRAMAFETGGTFSPSVKNPTGSATGLIQFIESTAKSLGTSTAALAQMTREEQMVYVEKYLTPYKGRMKDFGDIYMAIHLPVAIGKSDDYVIYDNVSLRTKAYEQNRGLDLNNDGKVTRGEAVTRAMKT